MERDAEHSLGRVRSQSVREATGRGWEEWLAILDAAGAAAWSHKETVSHLEREHPELTSWWRQSVTVGYEQARGKRVVGETADTGFQVGVQRTVAATVKVVWKVLTSQPELWLGEGAPVPLQEGESYDVTAGDGTVAARGVVRVVRPEHRLRMSWHPEGWRAAATLQLTVSASPSGKTALHAHLEKLPDPASREAMRSHWRTTLDRVAAAVAQV